MSKHLFGLRFSTISICGALILSVMSGCGEDVSAPKVNEPLKQIPFEQVSLNDNFWLPRLKVQKEVLVPFSFEKTEYAVENLRKVGAYLRGERVSEPLEGRYYVSSDLFKVMEGAAYLLTLERDAEIEAKMDEIIDIIAAAQKRDGYLYEHHTMPKHLRNSRNNRSTGDKPYSYVAHSHELYNMGHMYEGAIAYYRATGKRKWLDVAEKSAQHINRVFFEGDPNYNGGKPVMEAPGHEEIELALVKMYQVTGNKLYLDMAQKFVDIRGVHSNTNGTGVYASNYAQQNIPVREQREAVGHAVRAVYLYSGMADLVAINGDKSLLPTLDAVWHDIVDRKMHITGGLGAVAGIEGFGPAYELPNFKTYDETCAAVGNVMFNYRMYLMSGDAKYVDVAEVSLYNNVLAGVNLEGNRFFYVNPLEADGRRAFNRGKAGRSPWFTTACCPSNLARLIPQISGMIYSHTNDDIFCSFYVGSDVEVPLEAGAVKLSQRTEYPFEGDVSIEVEPAIEGEEFTLWLRIPSWLNDRFVPGELYSYADGLHSKYSVKVNGRRVCSDIVDGFLPVHRKWSVGDKVELSLPMKVRYSVADERVKADSNRLCVTRGPLVFCAEEPDNNAPVSRCYISSLNSKRGKVSRFENGVLSGIPTICVAADVAYDEKCEPTTLKLIPYYAWNNRGDNTQMNVWFGRDAATALSSSAILRLPENIADVKASHTNNQGDDVYAIVDGEQPRHSHDKSIMRWTSWKQQGKPQNIEILFKKAQPVERVSVYWYDDNGGVQRPKSWNIDYFAGGEWHEYKPYITDQFGTALDQFNMVHPAEAVVAEALRINMIPKDKDTAIGILELTIE